MFSAFPKNMYDSAFFWWQFAYMGAFFAVAFFFHFIIRYLELNRRAFVTIVYFLAFVFTFFNWYSRSRFFLGDIHFVFNQFYWIDALKYKNPLFFVFYSLFFWIILGYAFFLLLKAFRNSSGVTHDKLGYFIIAIGFGWIGTNPLFLSAFRINIYPYSNFLVALYPLLVAYVIVRHQVMDIEVVVKKTLVFAGLLASVFAALILPTLLIQEYIFRGAGVGGKMLGLAISGIIIIASLRRIEDFLINVTDKYLFQKEYDYKELLKTFTGEVLTVLDLNRLVKLTVDKLSDIIKITSCGVLLLNNEKNQYELVASNGIGSKGIALSMDNTLSSFLNRTRAYLSVKHQGKDSALPPRIVEDMNKLRLELAIPLVAHDEIIGILTLGKKKSDEDYTQDDMDILLPLAGTLAIAISNAEMFDELGKTQAEAAQREKMAVIGTLSAGINHEICNPLGIARGQCEAFLLNIKDGLYKNKSQQELFEKAKKIMEKVIHETDRATVITKRLSTFAKPSKGEISYDISVKHEIDEVLELVGYELKLDHIDIVKEISGALPFIFGDKKQIQEVFFNLIRNAAQAMDEKGRIAIRARKDTRKVVIDIEDTGHGIPGDKLTQIFNPFYTTKEPGKGTGLGLFIVRQVVERNRGRISVKSKVGEGTVFTLEFPMSAKVKV